MLEILLIMDEKTNSNDKEKIEFRFRFYLLGCVHRRNPYIRLDLGFQYGRFSCDGSRFLYIILRHCIVNAENHQY